MHASIIFTLMRKILFSRSRQQGGWGQVPHVTDALRERHAAVKFGNKQADLTWALAFFPQTSLRDNRRSSKWLTACMRRSQRLSLISVCLLTYVIYRVELATFAHAEPEHNKLDLTVGAKRHFHRKKLYTTTRIALRHRN